MDFDVLVGCVPELRHDILSHYSNLTISTLSRMLLDAQETHRSYLVTPLDFQGLWEFGDATSITVRHCI